MSAPGFAEGKADPTSTKTGRKKIVLRSSEFRKGREASWRDLEALVARVEKRGVASLPADELQRFPSLYRVAVSSLSVARSIALDRNMLRYLENLSLRAFLVVYGPRIDIQAGIADFFRRGLPRAVRSAAGHLLLAGLAMAIGTLAGFMLVYAEESWFTALVPGGLGGARGPSSTREELLNDEIFAPWPGAAQAIALMANFLFSHNTTVGLFAFGLGIAGGVPTVLLLVYQGLILGAFIALHVGHDLTIPFLGWLSIHGVTELAAIALFGAGGLLIGDKVLFPGRYSRLDSLAIHGRTAAQIAIGATLMLFVAAILEGVFRQLVQSTGLRFAIGGSFGLVWLIYFALAGRRETQ